MIRRPGTGSTAGFTLLELSFYVGLTAALLATIGAVELMARRSTFYQVIALDALEESERLTTAVDDDLEGRSIEAVDVADGVLTIRPAGADPVAYRRESDGRVLRVFGPEESALARHVGAFEPVVERDGSGRPVLVRVRVEVDRPIPGGTNRYRRVFEGVATVGAGVGR